MYSHRQILGGEGKKGQYPFKSDFCPKLELTIQAAIWGSYTIKEPFEAQKLIYRLYNNKAA